MVRSEVRTRSVPSQRQKSNGRAMPSSALKSRVFQLLEKVVTHVVHCFNAVFHLRHLRLSSGNAFSGSQFSLRDRLKFEIVCLQRSSRRKKLGKRPCGREAHCACQSSHGPPASGCHLSIGPRRSESKSGQAWWTTPRLTRFCPTYPGPDGKMFTCGSVMLHYTSLKPGSRSLSTSISTWEARSSICHPLTGL